MVELFDMLITGSERKRREWNKMFRTQTPGPVFLEGTELNRVVVKIEPTNDYAQVQETLWFAAEDSSGQASTEG